MFNLLKIGYGMMIGGIIATIIGVIVMACTNELNGFSLTFLIVGGIGMLGLPICLLALRLKK